jgi:hypothetical protein
MSNFVVETTLIHRGAVSLAEVGRYFDRDRKAFHSDVRTAVIDFGERVAMSSQPVSSEVKQDIEPFSFEYVAHYEDGSKLTVMLY